MFVKTVNTINKMSIFESIKIFIYKILMIFVRYEVSCYEDETCKKDSCFYKQYYPFKSMAMADKTYQSVVANREQLNQYLESDSELKKIRNQLDKVKTPYLKKISQRDESSAYVVRVLREMRADKLVRHFESRYYLSVSVLIAQNNLKRSFGEIRKQVGSPMLSVKWNYRNNITPYRFTL